jgi:hypothetical protein
MIAAAVIATLLAAPVVPVNIIDGTDDRGALNALGPSLGLSAAEMARIRQVSGHVGCFDPLPKVGSGALFLSDDLILTAAHMFFADGKRETKCFFRAQAPGADWVALKTGAGDARFGSADPKPGSNNDWAIVRLSTPIANATPFPADTAKPRTGDALIVISAHPDGMQDVPLDMPVVQGCTVRRAPVSSEATSFYRTDCDASPASSGGMHLFRGIDGALRFRGMTISTGPWSDGGLKGAPYNEKEGSVTTALGTDAAILAAGKQLAGQ